MRRGRLRHNAHRRPAVRRGHRGEATTQPPLPSDHDHMAQVTVPSAIARSRSHPSTTSSTMPAPTAASPLGGGGSHRRTLSLAAPRGA